MENDEMSGKPLQYYWNQYITTVNCKEKTKYLDGFLVEFLKTYFLAGGQLCKVPSFGDLHSVSNMLAREFQTLILAKCSSHDGDQEQLLVGYLCNGSGLMLLEVLCVLAYKIAGCSNELANLVVTLLRVIFRVPPHGHDFFQAFQMTKLDYQNYFQDSKCKPHHSSLIQELILKHCCYLTHTQTFTFDFQTTEESTLNPTTHDQTDSSSITESSDILTSISSMGSVGLHSSTDEPVELHRQSSGFSSLLDNTDVSNTLTGFVTTPSEGLTLGFDTTNSELTPAGQETGQLFSVGTLSAEGTQKTPTNELTPTGKGTYTSEGTPTILRDQEASCEEPTSERLTNDDTPTPHVVLSPQDISIDTFELLLLMLTLLENLCCRESSSYDTTLTVKTSGQLIDLVDSMTDKKDGDDNDCDHDDLEVLWDLVSSSIARLSILRTVLFFSYATFRNPKSAKQLVRNNYVSKLVAFVDNELPSALLTAEQVSELVKDVSSERTSSLWKTFSHVVFISLAFRGLLTFLTSCLQFGSLINSSLLALSRELLEQFSLADGFGHLATIALKCEEMYVPGSHSDSDMTSLAIAVKTLPKDTTLHVLSIVGKIVSLLKKSKLNCKAETDVVPRRKSVDSYLQFQPPSELMTSDVDESSESAGDMESENDKQTRNLVDQQCQILPPVTSLLNVFKESRAQSLSSSILSCLGNVGVCGCLQPGILISPLLTRFLFQPRPLQTQILKLINQLIITSLDDTILPKESPSVYPTRPRTKSKRLYSKSPKSSPSRSMGLSDNELYSRSLHHSARSLSESDTWSCLSQYCSFLTSGDHWLSLETAKSLRTLVQLGSLSLKNELFRVVLLPSIFRFDLRRKQDVDDMSTVTTTDPTNTQADAQSTTSDVGDTSSPVEIHSAGTPTNANIASTPTNDNISPSPTSSSLLTTRDRSLTLRPSRASLNKDVLQVLLGYLPALLVSQSSRLLFFNCGGLSEMQAFLDIDELQDLVIGVLEFLASLEDNSKSESRKDKDGDALEGEASEETVSAVKTFLTLLRSTASVKLSTESRTTSPEVPTVSKIASSDRITKCDENEIINSSQSDSGNVLLLDNTSLRFHVWKSCLSLLVSNKVFVDAFAADDGAKYSYGLLKWLISYFKGNVNARSSVNARSQDVYVVALFEVVLAVCIRISYTGITRDCKDFPDASSIIREVEQTVLNSSTIRESLNHGLCDSFTKAAVKKLHSSSLPNQQDNSEVLESIVAPMNPEGEWSQLMFDDDIDSPAVNKKSIEDGYEADNEVNTDSSADESDANVVKQAVQTKKPSRGSRTNTETSTLELHGLVIYPQICQFLFKLLEAAYSHNDYNTSSKSLSVLTHAAQSLLSLVKECEHNCRVLCDEGLLGSVVQCYKNILSSDQGQFRGLQAIVVDLLISLACQRFTASQLKDFIDIFKTPLIPIDLLCSGLANIASKACQTQRPAFMISFPCRIHTVDPRLKHAARKGKAQRLRQDSLIKRGKAGSLIQSTGDASSEGASTEGSLTKVSRHSPDCTERYSRRQTKTHSKSVRGSKARADTDSNKSNELLQTEDSADLPSPFSVKAVNLRCLGNQTWPVSELSIALWVRVHNQKRFPESDVSMSRDVNPSTRSNVEWPGSRSNSVSSDDAIHVCSYGSRKCLFEVWLFSSNASFLLRWTKFTKGGTDGYDVIKEVVTRPPSLTRGRWHHVVISLSQSKQRHVPVDNERTDACKILLIIDGTDATEHNFGPLLPQSEEKSTLSVALIGHVILTTSKKEKPGDEKVLLPDGYDVGSVMLFTAPPSKGPKKHSFDWLVGKNESFYLYSLGANSASVGHLQNELELLTSNNSSQPFLTASKLWSRLSITERSVGSELRTGLLTSPHIIIPDLESSLRGLLFLSYSPTNPSTFSQVMRSTLLDEKSRRTSQYDVTNKQPITNFVQNEAKLFHEVKAVRVSTLLEAAYDVGGMTVFIYLFAKVVEITNDPKTQADALSVVLSLQRNCEYHARAMDQQSGYALLKRILLSPQCMIGYHMLKVLMESACDGDVFKHTNLSDNPIMLNIDSNAVVRNVDIFQHYLLNWKIWDKAKQGVFEMLLSTLEILVHASHPHYKFNISQFQKAELVQQLLIGCQERQGEGLAEIPSSISTLYVNIIQSIMGSPPDLTVLKAVCEFLIAMHPTEETTRLHSPNRFYLSEHTFDFGYRVPSVTRKPLSPSSLTTPVLSIKKQSPLPTSTSSVTCSASNHSNSSLGNESFGNYSDLPRRESSSTLVNHQDDEPCDEVKDEVDVMGHSAASVSDNSFPEPTVEMIAPHYASCPQPRIEKKLTVQIPYGSSAIGRPVYGSADGASILLQNSPVRERNISLSSPTNSQTPPTPQTYKGPGSKPMSISQQSMTPKSVGMTSSVDVMEYDFINESDFSSLKSSLAHQSSVDEYLVVEGYPGIKSSTGTYKHVVNDRRKHVTDHMTKMRLGLLKLLQKVLLNLQAEQVPAVIGGVLRVEYLLVWVSHQSAAVRELVIKILCLYLQKAEAERYNHFVDIRGFHLLANQIYDHQVTKGTIEALLWLLVGRPVDLDKDYAYSTSMDHLLISTVRSLGVVPLVSIIEDTLISQHLHHMLVKHLCHLFLKVDELSLKAVAHGLLYTICNVICGLANLQYQQSKSEEDVTVDVNALLDDLQSLIASVVIRACSTCGTLYFQMFEDLLVVLENLEERDHRRREYGLSIFFIARYLRYFAIQVALHFFHEISKDDITANGRKRRKSSGIRFPFVTGSKTADTNPFNPVSSWIPLSHDHNMPCSDLGFLKDTPTTANFNEQTQRFQSVVQTAVNCVVYSRTLLSNDLSPLQFYAADLQVHECLRPAMIKGAANGVNIEKEFAQFVFSALFESLEKIMDGTLPSKILFVSKDVVKSQLGKVLVYLLSPSLSVDLSCFAVQIANHPHAKKFLQNLLTGSGGGKIREKLIVYLPMLLSDVKLNKSHLATAIDLKTLLESCGLKFASYDDSSSKNNTEVQVWDQTDTTNIMEWQKKRVEAFRVISQRIEILSGQVSKSAMDVTRVAVEIQDSQRQTLLKHNTDALSAEVQVRKKWRQLIERLVHERSIWYDRDYFPKSWRLDPTEGPLRVRCRMQRFHLDVPDKFVMDEHRKNSKEKCSSPLAYLFEDSSSSHHKNVYYIFDTQDTIRFLYHCRHILLDIKTKGVILIGESHMYFIGEEATTADTDVTQILLGNKDAISISWLIKEIQEIRTRRYCLQDIGVEVFLNNGRTYLLAFETENDRDIVLDQFKQRLLPIYETPATENIHNATMQWRSGNLSNFEYLTELNKMAGRTFNDLMQYPVFPFILSDFASEVLDLNDLSVYRDLSKPIAAQSQNKEMNYRERFRWLKEEYDRSGQDDPLLAPYHYGSHYSNSGTVLHFLVRLPPFTKMFLQYQDRSFDIPDRTFHSLATTWRLSSYESSTDVKELIPEFFFLPEFLENFEGFDFGHRQCGDRVMDVTLPPWAKGNTRLFILIHRQALETEHVSRQINKWIDLVFGYKQTGPEAVEAINVFHPATYFGVQVSSISDPIRQNALKTMIETYGQTPRQLFSFPHSPRLVHKNTLQDPLMSLTNAAKYDVETTSSTSTFINRFHQSFSSDITVTGTADTFTDAPKPVSTVEGLKWGHYVCSPSLPVPSIALNQPINVPGTSSVVCDRFDRVFVLCKDSTMLSVNDDRSDRALLTVVLSWSTVDGSLMVFPEGGGTGTWLMDVKTPDKVTCCAVTNGCTSLFIGSSSGALSYLPVSFNPTLECKIEFWGSRVRLYGHSQAVTCLKICHEYSILVSGSHDGTAIIWDLFRLSYIRTLEHETAVQTIAVSCRSGDVVTVSHQDNIIDDDSCCQDDQGSTLHLWTVNGRPVASAKCDHVINCVDFSRAPEGVSVNVIATGLSNGAIRLWSTWDLQHIRDIAPEQNIYPVISVAFSDDSQRLFALNTQSRLVMWQRKDKMNTRPPSVITFPSSYCGPKIQHDGRGKTDN